MLAWWGITRPTALVVGYLAVLLIGYGPPDSVTTQRIYPSDDLLNLPARWDSFFFVDIATRGYSWDGSHEEGQNVAFFPAFPLAMRAVAWIIPIPALWAGVLVSCAAFLLALVYLYRLARDLTDESTARWSVALLATYPGAVFFSATYAESVFLLASLGAFYHLRRRQLAAAAAWALLAGLTRVQGFLLCLPLAWMAWRDRRELAGVTWRGWIQTSMTVAAPLFGMALFSAYLWGLTGRPLLWLENQAGWGLPSYSYFLRGELPEAVPSSHPITFSDRVVDVGNYAAVAFVVAIAPRVVRLLGLEYGLLLAVCVLPPLLGHPVAGMMRYTSVVFPAFIALAHWLGTPPRVYRVAAVLFVGQCMGAALFFTWRHFI